MRQRPTSMLVVSAALLCAGCIATTIEDVVSHRTPAADPNPRRVLVVSYLPLGKSATLGPSLEKDLERRVQSHLARCGVSATGYAARSTAKHDDALAAKLREFQPEAVLVVDNDGGLVDQYGNIIFARYAFRLVQGAIASDRADVVWTAGAVYHPYGLGYAPMGPGRYPAAVFTGSMERYVDAVMGKMKADGFFPGCPITPLPFASAPVPAAAYAPRSTLTATGGVSLGKIVDHRTPDPMPQGGSCVGSGVGTCGGGTDGMNRLNGANVAEFAPSLAEYAGAALVAELHHMGIDTADARRKLDLEVEEARADDSGWGFGCRLRIRVTVREVATGKVLYADAKAVSSPVGSISTEVEALDVALRRTADQLAEDPEFEAAVR